MASSLLEADFAGGLQGVGNAASQFDLLGDGDIDREFHERLERHLEFWLAVLQERRAIRRLALTRLDVAQTSLPRPHGLELQSLVGEHLECVAALIEQDDD